MQGNARETYESGGKLPGECRGMQGNTGECQGNVGMQVNARGTYGSGCKLPGECRGMQGNIWEWVYSTRGMQGTTRKCKGAGVKC